MAKIMVAISGGVDSSLAAALLHEQGHEVVGVTLHLWDADDERLNESLCCAQEMAESARRVCAQLGVPYYVFNYQREFRRHVIDYFIQAAFNFPSLSDAYKYAAYDGLQRLQRRHARLPGLPSLTNIAAIRA